LVFLSRVDKFLIILLISFFITLLTSGLYTVSIANPQNPILSITVSETFDLRITRVVSEVETTFKRNLVLSRVWDRLVLNMSVQNFGDDLENVFLKIYTNGAPIQATFSTSEEVGLVQAFSYQFEIPQTLILTLNNTKQTELQLEILLLLDHRVSLRDPYVNFHIQKAELIAFELPQPLTREFLPVFNANHQYQIQPTRYSFLRKNLFITPVIYVQVPSGMELICTVLITLQGTGINYLTVDDQTIDVSEKSHSISFNSTMSKLYEDQDLSLTVSVAPDYEGLSKLTRVILSISVIGVLESRSTSPFVDVLGSHPIPGVLMFPILVISLFGIPYYFVYQEHLVDRDEDILDPKKQTKL